MHFMQMPIFAKNLLKLPHWILGCTSAILTLEKLLLHNYTSDIFAKDILTLRSRYSILMQKWTEVESVHCVSISIFYHGFLSKVIHMVEFRQVGGPQVVFLH